MSDGATSYGPRFETEAVLTCDLIIFTFAFSTSKWGGESSVLLASFLPIFSLLCPSILDLGPGTGSTDRRTDKQISTLNGKKIKHASYVRSNPWRCDTNRLFSDFISNFSVDPEKVGECAAGFTADIYFNGSTADLCAVPWWRSHRLHLTRMSATTHWPEVASATAAPRAGNYAS